MLLDDANIVHGFDHLGQRHLPGIQVGHLAAPEHHRHLDFITGLQKFADMTDLKVQIVFIRVGPQFDLFHMRRLLVLLHRMLFLVLLVFELSVIHDAADGWLRRRGYLHQVEPQLGRFGDGIPGGQNPQLLSGGADDPDFSNPNFVVDTLFDCDRCFLLSVASFDRPKTVEQKGG